MSSRTIAAVVVALTATNFPTRARAGQTEDLVERHEIIIAQVRGRSAARREMVRASLALELPIAYPTLDHPFRGRRPEGPVVAARLGARGAIIVSSFAGDEHGAARALATARAHYPRAADVPVWRPRLAADDSDEFADDADMLYFAYGVLVVASSPSYPVALAAAKSYSRASGRPYTSSGMVFDRKRGLIIPDDSDDEVLAGVYVPRRPGDACPDGRRVTVERSEFYEGLESGLYIVVAGILEPSEFSRRLEEARRSTPDAFVKPSIIYVGCRH